MRVWRVRDAVLGVTQRVGKMHTIMKVIVVSGEHGIDASQYLEREEARDERCGAVRVRMRPDRDASPYRWPSKLQIRKKTRIAAV